MKRKTLIFVLVIIAVTLIALIFAGCQEEKKGYSMQNEAEIHIPAPIDTSAMDEEFYRRMRLFDAMFPDRGLDK